MTSPWTTAFVGSVLLQVGAASAQTQNFEIPTSQSKPPTYTWITSLSQGPIDWFEERKEAAVQGRAYRLVAVVSEIYDTVFIETVTFGAEGCCKKLSTTRKLDLDALAKTFGLVGEQSGFALVDWESPSSLRVRFMGHEFLLSHIERERVLVEQWQNRK